MPRASTKKLYRTFVKGLITEASALTYPENASINEDNCIIYRKGNRTRRYGVDFEDNHFLSSHSVSVSSFNEKSYTEYVWTAAANKTDYNFLVHQVGLTLYFYDLAVTPISAGLKSFTVDLSLYVTARADPTKINSTQVSMAVGKGYLFVVSAQIEPLIITYNPDTNNISVERIYIQIRDFQGVDDNLALDEEPVTLTSQHKYNLLNQGWHNSANDGSSGSTAASFTLFGRLKSTILPDQGPIDAYKTETGRYPGNNKQWWVSKNPETGDFDPALLEKQFFGASAAPRGHFVVDAFKIDRSAVSGVTGIPVESLVERPTAVSFFAGRSWFGLNSSIYFSQIMDGKHRAGKCFQEADPTSEYISDLVDTDGGVIQIPEMGRVVRLIPSGGGLLVFANNGVWFISGGGGTGFTATDFSVVKAANTGTESPLSVVETDDKIFYWARIGIQAISQKAGMFGPIEGTFEKTNISEDTIQSFYVDEVATGSRMSVKGVYDAGTNVIQWLFRNEDETDTWAYNRLLNFDVTLAAFYPWSVNSDNCRIIGVFNANLVSVTPKRKSYTKYICAVPNGSDYKFTIADFNNDNYCDWETYDGVGIHYNSFVETGYELLEDAMRDKQANYVFVYFRQTAENFVSDGSGGYTLDKPSSCYFQVKWDWASSSVSNKWSTKVQAYRVHRGPFVNEDDLAFDTGFPIVVTKNKVRGNGRAIQFRFENDEIGSDFDLLGWAVAYSGKTEV